MTEPEKRKGLRAILAAVGVLCASLSWWSTADPAPASEPPFTGDEMRRILAHGPWPVPVARDPSNRVSGRPEAVDLGTRLFFDERLSRTGKVSCATCHVPERNWTDNQKRATGISEMERNTPTLMNVRLNRWFGWDGGADSLWSQTIRPMLDARELGASPRHVADLVRNDADLACRYDKAFGRPPSATDDEAVMVDLAKALAAFQETLQSGRTPFDAFRDALARGEPASRWNYSEAAQRGLKIFIGKGSCSICHSGPNFTSGEFHDIGLSHFVAPGRVDAGRHEGIGKLRASRYNLLGPYNDDVTRSTAISTRHVALEHRNFGEFKVPSLRNIMLTAPYGHDGQLATVADTVRHYSQLNVERLHADGERILKPLGLTEREQSDLVVFLESLSTFTNPWRPEDGDTCR